MYAALLARKVEKRTGAEADSMVTGIPRTFANGRLLNRYLPLKRRTE